MSRKETFSKTEISKILKKASEIQTQKDLYGDKEGLTEEELIQLAAEVGIDQDSLLAAIEDSGDTYSEESYSLFKGNSKLQNTRNIPATFTDDQWTDIIQEIRRVTGGIGKVSQNGSSYEWEQRKRDIGYKHITLNKKKDTTTLQMVYSWGPMKMMVSFLGGFFGFVLTLITFKVFYSKEIALMLTPFGVVTGFLLSRIYLGSFYNRQKRQFSSLTKAIIDKIRPESPSPQIQIEEEDVYSGQPSETEDLPKERLS